MDGFREEMNTFVSFQTHWATRDNHILLKQFVCEMFLWKRKDDSDSNPCTSNKSSKPHQQATPKRNIACLSKCQASERWSRCQTRRFRQEIPRFHAVEHCSASRHHYSKDNWLTKSCHPAWQNSENENLISFPAFLWQEAHRFWANSKYARRPDPRTCPPPNTV